MSTHKRSLQKPYNFTLNILYSYFFFSSVCSVSQDGNDDLKVNNNNNDRQQRFMCETRLEHGEKEEEKTQSVILI